MTLAPKTSSLQALEAEPCCTTPANQICRIFVYQHRKCGGGRRFADCPTFPARWDLMLENVCLLTNTAPYTN
jgi:hypothetical protein